MQLNSRAIFIYGPNISIIKFKLNSTVQLKPIKNYYRNFYFQVISHSILYQNLSQNSLALLKYSINEEYLIGIKLPIKFGSQILVHNKKSLQLLGSSDIFYLTLLFPMVQLSSLNIQYIQGHVLQNPLKHNGSIESHFDLHPTFLTQKKSDRHGGQILLVGVPKSCTTTA
ncbi:unnamed protein product [Paramecium sonneborni]|uniref:Uncharacterized protein n=1 Tax=Paramecium sonneborni TaxID=65129 RepID=A0A8S1QUY5_9CILI|nr:unnamed protein product [Paramecium sonneborni]